MRTVQFQNQTGATVTWRPVSDRTEEVLQRFPSPQYGRSTRFIPWPDSPRHVCFVAEMFHHAAGRTWTVATRHAMGRVEAWGEMETQETASIQRLYQALGFPGNVSGEPGGVIPIERDGVAIQWRPLDDRTGDVLKAYPIPDYEVRTGLHFWPGIKHQIWFRAILVHHTDGGAGEQVIASSHAAGLISHCKDLEIIETRAIQRLYGALGMGGEIFDPDEDRDRAGVGAIFPWDEPPPEPGRSGSMGKEQMVEMLANMVAG
ncbi:hypothetical protein B1B_01802 [mine drainage metagenome]|uniref:Uncharacterized protein n=1 Tax=mine drainage metagenome TaxID=410659 RepID=T1BTL3_9ZZZZ